jgi:hypothetical protein
MIFCACQIRKKRVFPQKLQPRGRKLRLVILEAEINFMNPFDCNLWKDFNLSTFIVVIV